jgi:hypothetical protein
MIADAQRNLRMTALATSALSVLCFGGGLVMMGVAVTKPTTVKLLAALGHVAAGTVLGLIGRSMKRNVLSPAQTAAEELKRVSRESAEKLLAKYRSPGAVERMVEQARKDSGQPGSKPAAAPALELDGEVEDFGQTLDGYEARVAENADRLSAPPTEGVGGVLGLLNIDLVKELGLEKLPEKRRQELIEQMTDVVDGRVNMKLLAMLSEQQKKDLDKVLDANGDVGGFFRQRIPGFEVFVAGIIADFKKEMLELHRAAWQGGIADVGGRKTPGP